MCVYVYLSIYLYISIYIYSVLSHSFSVSRHICPNIFPELILPSGQYFKIQSDPILSSPFITCHVSVRSVSSVEFARWVYL